MRYTLTYARVGNARPLYCLRDEYGAHVMCRTVECVWDELAMHLPRVKGLCRRARDGESVEFHT